MIELHQLCKAFSGSGGETVYAVDHLDLQVRPGEIVGLLGPNGAGKTTTLRMLCTLLKPTGGSARVAGYDVVEHPQEVRRAIGFLSSNTGIYERMTAKEMVSYYGRLNGMAEDALSARLEELFELLQMNEFRDVYGSKMSTGMKQKVSIARALIHDPPVLIFDEPTNGLDVLVQRSVLRFVAGLREKGKAVLFSTHIMREVEKLCDRVAIMHKGRLLAVGGLDELRDRYEERDLEELFFRLMGE